MMPNSQAIKNDRPNLSAIKAKRIQKIKDTLDLPFKEQRELSRKRAMEAVQGHGVTLFILSTLLLGYTLGAFPVSMPLVARLGVFSISLPVVLTCSAIAMVLDVFLDKIILGFRLLRKPKRELELGLKNLERYEDDFGNTYREGDEVLRQFNATEPKTILPNVFKLAVFLMLSSMASFFAAPMAASMAMTMASLQLCNIITALLKPQLDPLDLWFKSKGFPEKTGSMLVKYMSLAALIFSQQGAPNAHLLGFQSRFVPTMIFITAQELMSGIYKVCESLVTIGMNMGQRSRLAENIYDTLEEDNESDSDHNARNSVWKVSSNTQMLSSIGCSDKDIFNLQRHI